MLTSEHGRVGAVYLTREEIAARVTALGAEITSDYEGRDLLLIAPLKSSVVFLADLTRAVPLPHALDVVELAPYSEGRDVIVVEDVVDTGLTLHFLYRTLALRDPASLVAVTLLDRPYRRLVEDIPLRYVGFTVPDELFAGYGLGLDERWRALPDLHLVVGTELPEAASEAA